MIELDDLITYWRDRQQLHPPITRFTWEDVIQSTAAYLIAFKQSKEMLTRLADVYEGLEKEGETK